MTDYKVNRPRVLIEDWLPVAELGIESRRERAVVTMIPPLNWLHVWWARRPLVASAAVVLGGLLPTWSQELADRHPEYPEVATEKSYHRWFLHLIGVWGDPVAAKRLLDAANATGQKIKGNGYGYKQAYRNMPDRTHLALLHKLLVETWGEMPLVADPTAGGGSIPFVAMRLGIPAFGNDLNGVAASVLRAGVDIPSREGLELVPALRSWGRILLDRIEDRLTEYFPLASGESIVAYIWVNVVNCPRTGRPVPLMPDMWLRRDRGHEAAVELMVDGNADDPEPRFRLVLGKDVDAKKASQGTLKRGSATSPYDNLVIDGDYIKSEAQAGRMSQILYAVSTKANDGTRGFRLPTPAESSAVRKAQEDYERKRREWISEGVVPSGDVPDGLKTAEPLRYGLATWDQFFIPRQLLVHGTFVEEFRRLVPEIRDQDPDRADDVLFLLALMQGKALNWNARLSSWNVGSQGMRSVFDRHDFAFKWTFAEFEGARALYGWSLDRVVAAYEAIARMLLVPSQELLDADQNISRSVVISQGSATSLTALTDGEVAHLCMDPPYYDNVMYAELSDFLYVWEKETLGAIAPGFFPQDLADKDNEAVANPARFEAMGKRKRELADLDYESKMTAIFAECRRVLRDDGVMSVMFTHKRAEAWDTLGMGLLQAGFTVETSWPVNTEKQQSLHQANVNSAASTIMLVCRKRDSASGDKIFLDDLESDVRQAARVAAERFGAFGIEGVDLLLSTYGPVLSVISSHWPVYSSEADVDGRSRLLRPDEALAIAREEVVRLIRTRIIGHDTTIDNHSDFVLIAWETFKAHEFSFDEARRLALSVGALDMEELARAKVVEKKSGAVRLLPPRERLRRGGDDTSTGVRIDARRFECMNDALDTVMYVAEVDGMADAKALMDRIGLTGDERFRAYVQGLVNAMPRVKVKGEWVIPEAGLLDTLVTAYLPDVTLPAEPEIVVEVEEAPTLFD